MDRVRCAIAVVFSLAGVCGFADLAFAQGTVPAPERVDSVKSDSTMTADVQAVRDELDRLKEEFAAIRRQYDERLLVLEDRLGRITGGPRIAEPVQADAGPAAQAPQATQVPPAAPDSGATAQSAAAAAGSSKIFNPDTSVIGNFVAVGGKNDYSTQPSLQLTEAEVAFQAVIDPYARADFFLAAGPEGLDVEEGYVTFTALPGNMLLKAGKMRAQFGKVNTLHTHAMPTVDRPLVTNNLVGGEEGISDSGLSLSHLIQNPFLYLEVTGEVFTGDSAVFQTDRRSRLNYVGRLRAYRDLTEDKNLDFGLSYAFGPTEGADVPAAISTTDPTRELNRQLIGFDATFRYRPLRRAIYQRLNLRTELIWSRQDLAVGDTTAFGMYGLGEYQFARRWYAGARFDRSARPFDGTATDTGASVFVTFWPTEFSQVRTQYRWTGFAEKVNANELLFQLNFSIGAHGAHAF